MMYWPQGRSLNHHNHGFKRITLEPHRYLRISNGPHWSELNITGLLTAGAPNESQYSESGQRVNRGSHVQHQSKVMSGSHKMNRHRRVRISSPLGASAMTYNCDSHTR